MFKSFNLEIKGTRSFPNEFFGGPLQLMLEKIIAGPLLFPEGLVMTYVNFPSVIELTKEKVFCLMSLSFFGLLRYNFPELLSNPEYGQCMANYYIRMYKEAQNDINWMQKPFNIERRVLHKKIFWENSTKTLKGLKIFEEKIGIEDLRDACQINFADPYPGGTLPSTHGDIVQEEILFLVYPELFITCVLVPRIDTRESIVVSGLTRTNKYKGYQWSFSFAGDFDKDSNAITVIHMDALPGGERDRQSVDRELNKAYISFINHGGKPVATGHWGCGAFGGNHQRKAIIQLIAAAEAEVDLQYTTYGTRHINGLQEFYSLMIQNHITISQLYRALLNHLSWGRGGAIFSEIQRELLRPEIKKE
jgi:poly(ADP-ribose) glycohydrolase